MRQEIISLSTSGNITEAGALLQQAYSDAISQNKIDLLPNMETYTAYMTALLETQQKIILSLPSKDAIVQIISIAERAHNLLVQMEDLSGVSDEYHPSMRMSGAMIESPSSTIMRQSNLQPNTMHYNLVLATFANASIASHDYNYTTHFTLNAPYIAQRWLVRMETLSKVAATAAVSPTLESYQNVMKACSMVLPSNMNQKQSKSPMLTQAIFDKLRQNSNISPTVEEYRLLMQTWASSSSGCKDSAFRATGVWMDMQRAFRRGDKAMEPTLEDGKRVLQSWSVAV